MGKLKAYSFLGAFILSIAFWAGILWWILK
jgi:hypothetical protein